MDVGFLVTEAEMQIAQGDSQSAEAYTKCLMPNKDEVGSGSLGQTPATDKEMLTISDCRWKS